MRIMLRTYFRPDMKSVLAGDPVVRDGLDPDAHYFWIDAESEMFDRLLKLTKGSSGFHLTAEMEFDAGELEAVEHYQVVNRKTLKETRRDYSLNIANLRATDLIATGDGLSIRLMEKMALSKIDLRPNMVGHLDEWAEEYVVAEGAAGAFKMCGLTGFETRPVFNPKSGENHTHHFQLYAGNIMPPAVRDLSVIEIESEFLEERLLRHLGCLTYKLEGSVTVKDFNRTAEAWSSNDLPLWVVSKKVVRCFQRNKLKGWAFRPVLDKESDLYAKYITKWTALLQKISINSLNRF